MYDHITWVRQKQCQHFYHSACALQHRTPSANSIPPEVFFKQLREGDLSKSLSQLLLFGEKQYPFLEEVVSNFPTPETLKDLFDTTRDISEALLPLFERLFTFRREYLSVISSFMPFPLSFFFDPKGFGGNLPGKIFQENLSNAEIHWCASPQPFLREGMAPEAEALLSVWKKRQTPSLWLYCNFQSLCHYWEKKRSLALSSLARAYPSHMKVLHITKDSPLYLKAPLSLSLPKLFQQVVEELQKEDSLYQTSLEPSLHKVWTIHALDVAESAYQWVRKRSSSSSIFMELFSLGLSRRWVGFSLAKEEVQDVYLMQTCKEGIDRGAVWMFELAASLSSLSLRELQALLWGRALLARGRLPAPYRYRGARDLLLSEPKDQIALWLREQLDSGFMKKITNWNLQLVR